MILYFLRHASAGVSRSNPLIDVKRPLDKEGLLQCVLVANLLNALHVQVDVILSSPLKRALQTASKVGTEIGYDSKIHVSKALAPTASLADFRAQLVPYAKYESVMVVGHNPNLAFFLGSILDGNGKPLNIRLRKGSIARVNMEDRPAKLEWLVNPRVLQASVAKSSRRKTSKK